MIAGYFNPELEWKPTYSVYVTSLAPNLVSYEKIHKECKLARPDQHAVDRALIKLHQHKLPLRAKRIDEIFAEDDNHYEKIYALINKEYGAAAKKEFDEQVLDAVWAEFNCILFRMKAHYNLARPYQYDSRLRPMFRPEHPSFPSGHSSQCHMIAIMAEACFGAKIGKPSWKIADRVAENREIAGVHYAFDSAAGVKLAMVFSRHILRNRQIAARVAKLRTKWKRTTRE